MAKGEFAIFANICYCVYMSFFGGYYIKLWIRCSSRITLAIKSSICVIWFLAEKGILFE